MKKISSTSTYNKIQALLESIKSEKFDSRNEIEEYIINLNQPIFFVKKYTPPPVDAYIPEFSIKAVKKIIKLGIVLGMLSEKGLTSIGKDALKKNNFDLVLSQQIIDLLLQNNIDLKSLNKIVESFLKERTPTLPTASEIFKKIENKTEIKYLFFSKLLTLLAHTEYVRTSQTKIYLEFYSK